MEISPHNTKSLAARTLSIDWMDLYEWTWESGLFHVLNVFQVFEGLVSREKFDS